MVTLVIVISCFTWFYPARIMRAQVLSLREKEFVEAARMTPQTTPAVDHSPPATPQNALVASGSPGRPDRSNCPFA